MFKKAFASFLVFVFVCFSLSTFLVWFLFNSARHFDYDNEVFVNAFADFFGDAFVQKMVEYEDIPLTENDYREVVKEALDGGEMKGVLQNFYETTFQQPINNREWRVGFEVEELMYGGNGLGVAIAERLYDGLAVCAEESVFDLYTCRAEDISAEDFEALVLNDLRKREIFGDLVVEAEFPLKVSGSLSAFLSSVVNSFLLFSGVCLFVMLAGVGLLTLEKPLRAVRWVGVALLVATGLMTLFVLGFGRLPDLFNIASGAEGFALSFEQSQLVFNLLKLSIGDYAAAVLPYFAGVSFFFLLDVVLLTVLIRRNDF